MTEHKGVTKWLWRSIAVCQPLQKFDSGNEETMSAQERRWQNALTGCAYRLLTFAS
ncbi:MAG: hypothetical protein ACLVJ6_03805 [Merdibacter sp.]